jgi:hypothetical protein
VSTINHMPLRPISVRALQIALLLEIVWALFVADWVHRYTAHVPWQQVVFSYVGAVAVPAIAIVVVTWLVDQVVSASQLRSVWAKGRGWR